MRKISAGENFPFKCKECGWYIPQDLIENLIQGKQIYCERCGSVNGEQDFPIQKLNQIKKGQSTHPTLLNTFSSIRKKSSIFTKKLKTRIKEAMEKSEEK